MVLHPFVRLLAALGVAFLYLQWQELSGVPYLTAFAGWTLSGYCVLDMAVGPFVRDPKNHSQHWAKLFLGLLVSYFLIQSATVGVFELNPLPPVWHWVVTAAVWLTLCWLYRSPGETALQSASPAVPASMPGKPDVPAASGKLTTPSHGEQSPPAKSGFPLATVKPARPIGQLRDNANRMLIDGRTEEAVDLYQTIVAEQTRIHGTQSTAVMFAEMELGVALLNLDKNREAELCFLHAATVQEQMGLQAAPAYGVANMNYARACAVQGKFTEAVTAYRKAHQVLVRVGAPVQEMIRQVRRDLAKLYLITGNEPAAEEMRRLLASPVFQYEAAVESESVKGLDLPEHADAAIDSEAYATASRPRTRPSKQAMQRG